MKIHSKYSHLNGEEYLLVHRSDLWEEVQDVIQNIDAYIYKTKISREKSKKGELLFSPIEMNQAFKDSLTQLGWKERRTNFWLTHDEKLLRSIYQLPEDQQQQIIKEDGLNPIRSFNQTDFVKDRVALEIQFGKYAFVAHDLFVKHLSFYIADIIDVGIEVLPMKALEKKMSSGVPYYERDLLNVLRQGRGSPAVPLVLVGLTP